MASRLQDVILRGLAAGKPLATAVAPGTLYYSTDLSATERSDGLVWESYSGSGSSVPLHAPTHSLGGTDPVDVTDLAGYPGGGTTFLKDDGTFGAPSGGVPASHTATHNAGGTDPITITNLAGFPGGTTNFLRSDGTFNAPVAAPRISTISMIIDGGASVITTGLKGYLEIPFACTIQAVTLLADVSGSIVVDIWKDTYANYPPVVADTIVASAKPTISAALKSQNTTLTGWNTTINAGDILGFNVDSVATIKKLTLSLKVQIP